MARKKLRNNSHLQLAPRLPVVVDRDAISNFEPAARLTALLQAASTRAAVAAAATAAKQAFTSLLAPFFHLFNGEMAKFGVFLTLGRLGWALSSLAQ
jgi:hypothetical protein